jgi:hypothetical protein
VRGQPRIGSFGHKFFEINILPVSPLYAWIYGESGGSPKGKSFAIYALAGARHKKCEGGTPSHHVIIHALEPECLTYIRISFTCVAMYHLLPNASFTPALRSP